MKKFSNKALIIVLMALIGVYAIVEFTGNKKRSSSLRSVLVEIDTANVTKINVISSAGNVNLNKEGDDWKVSLDEDRMVSASKVSVDNALNALLSIVPSRMATKSEAKWKDYQVDSTGIRVEVFESDEKTLDIVLGRFGMEGRNAYHTFVRLSDDKEVYAANNFMGFSIGSEVSSYRDQVLAKISKDSLTSILLNYPADTSVMMTNDNGQWSVNGQPADSATTAGYLSKLAYLSSKEFVDEQSDLTVPTITATFSFSNAQDIVVEGFEKESNWILHSSGNEEGYFQDMALFNKIFKPVSEFSK